MNSKELGELGERCAENFLTSQNYLILAKNYRCRFGEIDLIAIDRSCEPTELVFVEVKTRTGDHFGEPQEHVNFQKRAKILKTVFHFFSSGKKISTPYWRIDVIALKLNKQFKLLAIEHLKNILNGD